MKITNKKIGILTFYNANNYGAVLQAFALQQAARNLRGYEVYMVNYKSQAIEKRYKFYKVEGGFKTKLHKKLDNFYLKRKYKNVEKFRTKYLNVGTDSDMFNYDTIIVGSDQVWNYELTENDFVYFLEGIKDVKKCSYAPSFGVSDIDPSVMQRIKKCLLDFDYLTVREDAGKRIIYDLTGKEVPVVSDPTLLLTKEEWIKQLDIKQKRKKYILVYLFGNIKDGLQYAQWLSENTGLPIVCIDSAVKKVIKAKYVRSASPKEWVELFVNARYVVTNSFHGLMFSLIFEKEFFIAPLQNTMKTGSRIDNILSTLDLGYRKILGSYMKKPIDYAAVNKKIAQIAAESKKQLTTMLDI